MPASQPARPIAHRFPNHDLTREPGRACRPPQSMAACLQLLTLAAPTRAASQLPWCQVAAKRERFQIDRAGKASVSTTLVLREKCNWQHGFPADASATLQVIKRPGDSLMYNSRDGERVSNELCGARKLQPGLKWGGVQKRVLFRGHIQ